MIAQSDDGPHLIGGRCAACSTVTFPRSEACPRCAGEDIAEEPLGRRGTLWTWTVQGFPPKSPPYAGATGPDFEPFAVGYVELPGQVKVEARLTSTAPEALRIGAELELVLLPLADDAVTFAFAPVGEARL